MTETSATSFSASSASSLITELGKGLGHNDIFFAAVKKTRMPMIVTDPHQPDNPIIFANEAFLRTTGYALEEVLGRNCRFLQGPDTRQDHLAEIRQALHEQRDCNVELLNYRKDGTTFWNALFISPVLDPQGELIYYFASQLDVSRRRDAEDALRQAQKMEALGQLTGGIAHDFNNLLQVMVGYLDILRINLDRAELDRDKAKRHVDNTREAVNRAATLTQQLLAFARKQRLTGRAVDLNKLIEGRQGRLAQALGAPFRFIFRPAPALWNCRLDPIQLETALLNIVDNARLAMLERGTGTLTLETLNVEITGQDLAHGGLSQGHYVCIALTDTGCGMSTDILGRALDPFFTTREEGQGSGLGLSTVYGFLKQSGGLVRLYSEEGVGTSVRLYFPVSEDEAREHPTPLPTLHEDSGGSETVLVVDDRPDVAALAQAILEEAGYQVYVAHNGQQALDLLARETSIDLLFSDLIMPGGMNGVMLAKEAQRRQPTLRILLTTGYANNALELEEGNGERFPILNKPYGRQDLTRSVRHLLDVARP
ncbi:histidine kinase famiy protein [Pseudomonas sp. EpS/L25]|uniref:histidine kinase famiy protein n=1 Tax=Pseudomonas sp. EpS/L25 TaxID=1749078 RepID=UPI0007444E32|nr:histidine kinase famiy protein [Pseudomonas sp. EpS/L25]KUM44563.1 hybrid sensor histidine kinase/response regulator [Pseudomonas sp. EpS/L25]